MPVTLMGVEPEILASTESEGWKILDLAMATKQQANEESKVLTHALMEAGAEAARLITGIQKMNWVSRALIGVSRAMMGRGYSEELEYPRTLWKFSVPLLKCIVKPYEFLRLSIPGGKNLANKMGERMWRYALAIGLQGQPATFKMPDEIKSKKVRVK